MVAPCEGLRVLDFTHSYPGAMASMVLADSGAEVVKAEPPTGDPTRRHYAWVMWHRGKKSVVLDLKTKAGRDNARQLADRADVVLESYRPGVADRLGVGYEALAKTNPSLVYCSITGFGPTGPLAKVRGYQGIVDSIAGRMDAFYHLVGELRPRYPVLAIASHGVAMNAVQGIMAALLVRDRSGQGQRVDTSLVQGLGSYDLMGSLAWQLVERGEGQPPNRYSGSVPPYMTARTKDGHWLQFGNLTRDTLRNFLRQVELEHLLEDERYKNMPVFPTPEDKDAVQRLCLEKVLEKTRDEWMEIFINNDVTAEPFRSTQEGLSHPQAVHHGDVIERVDPRFGPTKQLGPIGILAETPISPGGPAPELGEHTKEVLASLDKPRVPAVHRNGRPLPAHPLSGITVLQFASYIAAPLATALLADLGARVITVEPITGDLYRAMGFPKMAKTLQGKESLSLDLKDPEAQGVVHKLAKQADILIHNYRPGVPDRLRMDYQTIRKINPKIIYVYAGAYGSTGPHAARAGFHPIAGAITGGPVFQAGRLLPPPEAPMTLDEIQELSTIMARANESNPDPSAALACCSAMLLALYARERTGKGQYLETSMLCGNLYANADDALSYEGKPERTLPDAEMNGLHALYRLYRCKEAWVFLACPQEQEWRAFARAAGLDGLLKDPRFATKESRLQNDPALSKALEGEFQRRSAEEWQALLLPADVACVEVYEGENGKFMISAPWVREVGFMQETYHPGLGNYLRHAPPFTFSLTPGVAGSNVNLGEQTREILQDLGYDLDAIIALEERGIAVYTPAEAEVAQSGESAASMVSLTRSKSR